MITLPIIGSVGLGSLIAAFLSWGENHSIIWLFIHGFFGWFYVIYYFLTGQGHA